MVSFITDPAAIAALDDKEKNRIIACLLSVKGELKDFKIDWAQAGARFNTTPESMRVNSRKALAKIKIENTEDGAATPMAMVAEVGDHEKTPTAAPKPKTQRKPRTPKTKKDYEDNDGEDNEVADTSAATSVKMRTATKRKAGGESGESTPKKLRTPRKKAPPKIAETAKDEETGAKEGGEVEAHQDEEVEKEHSEGAVRRQRSAT